MKIDAVIPLDCKDKDNIEGLINSSKKYVGINNFYIITNCKEELENLNKRKDVIVIDEKDLNIPSIHDIEKRYVDSGNQQLSHRAGWILQQLCKISASREIKELSDTYMIFCGDIMFCKEYKPHLHGKKFYHPISVECHVPYLITNEKMLGCKSLVNSKTNQPISFTCHHMMFNKELCNKMLSFLEEKHQKAWYDAYLDVLDYSESSNVSDYDTYAYYCMSYHPDECEINTDVRWIHFCSEKPSEEILKSRNITYYAIHDYMKKESGWIRFSHED